MTNFQHLHDLEQDLAAELSGLYIRLAREVVDAGAVLTQVHDLLRPGGVVLFAESFVVYEACRTMNDRAHPICLTKNYYAKFCQPVQPTTKEHI